jgi:hypothetical protein
VLDVGSGRPDVAEEKVPMRERCVVFGDVWERPPGGDEGLLYQLLREIRRRRLAAEGYYTLAADSGDRAGAVRWIAVSLVLAGLEDWVAARAQR